MKFDIVRAWKDESYRQTLSDEELNMLPANPAGEVELNDADLEAVSGGNALSVGTGFGGVGGFGGGLGGFGGGAVAVNRTNSVAVICEINIFSLNIGNIALLGSVNNICINEN